MGWKDDPIVASAEARPKWLDDPVVAPAPQVSGAPQSIGDQLSAGFTAGVEALPIVGPKTLEGLERLKGFVQGRPYEDVAASDKVQVDQNPVASTTGRVAGTVLPFAVGGAIPGVGRALGMTGNLVTRALMGGVSGAGITTADDLARGKTMEQVEADALAGGGIGAAVPVALRGLLGAKNAVSAALRGGAAETGPDVSRLMKDAAGPMFDAARGSGVAVHPESFQRFAVDTATKIAQQGLDRQLHPDTYMVLQRMLNEGVDQPMTLRRLHTLRQVAQDAARGSEARDASKSGQIVDALDDFIGSLKPEDLATHAARAPEAVSQLQNGIRLWAQASKTSRIEEALYRASNSASGLENGIRNEFRKLLQAPSTRRMFSAEERALIEQVVRGTTGANLAKLIGKFGFGRGASTNTLGGTIGVSTGAALGGAPGAIAAALLGATARRASEVATERGAQRVLHAVSGGAADGPPGLSRSVADALQHINRTPANIPLAPAAVPLLLKPEPIRITVHGGS